MTDQDNMLRLFKLMGEKVEWESDDGRRLRLAPGQYNWERERYRTYSATGKSEWVWDMSFHNHEALRLLEHAALEGLREKWDKVKVIFDVPGVRVALVLIRYDDGKSQYTEREYPAPTYLEALIAAWEGEGT